MNTQKFTLNQMLDACRASYGLITPMARLLGCDPQTVRNYIKRYPTLAKAVQEQRDRLVDAAELALIKKVQDGDTQAIFFTLRTLGKERGYYPKQETEQAGKLEIEYINDWRRLDA